jgi:serine protease AprX
MKYSRLLLFIIIASSLSFAQHQAPLGRILDRMYPTMGGTDEVVVWVYFRDKGADASQRLIAPATAYISERSISRRQNAMKSAGVIGIEDLPLERRYVESVALLAKRVRHEAKWFNAMSVVVTKDQIERVRRLPFVSEVELVGRFRKRMPDIEESTMVPEPHPPVSQSPTLLNYGNSLTQNSQINTVAVHNLGIDGSGVLIGVFDAGFSNLTHPALVTRPIVARYDFVTNSTTLGSHSHGQGTFSVVGGFADGSLIGPAYGASFVLARTEDATPETPIEEDNWVRAIIWADSIGIDVATTSLGYNDFDPPWPDYTWQDLDGVTSVITRAADRAVEMGIVVVNSAGNGGDISAPQNTLGAPADGFNVIAVGAVGSSGTRSSFSSVGPSADGRVKPDVMAMGSGVTGASGATGYTSTLNGTSFSCPLAAGVAALVLSGNLEFNLTPLQVREAMRQTANRVNNPDRYYGWGILDALKATNYVWIEHSPLANTEDTTARTVVVSLKSRIPLIGDSTLIVYGIGGNFTGSAPLLPTGNPNEYSALIPYLGSDVSVTYYFKAKNANVSVRNPLAAPIAYYSYVVGQDVAGPSVSHRPLGNQSIEGFPLRVEAVVTDPSGIDSVLVEYSVNGEQRPPFHLQLTGGNVFSDTFNVAKSAVSPGDSIAYRIVAVDASSGNNVSLFPSSGTIGFRVVNYRNVNLQFGNNGGGFNGTNDWQWGMPSGSSPPPRSDPRYWGTNLAGNYTVGPRLSSLTSGIYDVFSDRAVFSFWQWYEVQSRFDGGNVKASINGGPFQVLTPVDGYPIPSIYNGFGNPLAGQPGFSDVGATSWEKVTFDLTGIAFEGNTITIRLDFGADNSIQYRGWYIDDFVTDGIGVLIPTDVSGGESMPLEFALNQNYPNPFNPSTNFRYSIPARGLVRLAVFDILGREVAVLVDEVQDAGLHSTAWDASHLASGVYFYRLTTSGRATTKKLMLLR